MDNKDCCPKCRVKTGNVLEFNVWWERWKGLADAIDWPHPDAESFVELWSDGLTPAEALALELSYAG